MTEEVDIQHLLNIPGGISADACFSYENVKIHKVDETGKKIKENGEYVIEEEKTICKGIKQSKFVNYLEERFFPVTFNDTLYICYNGMYTENKGHVEMLIGYLLKQKLPNIPKQKIFKELIIELKTRHVYSEYPFNNHPRLLPVKNGVIELTTDHNIKLHAHDPTKFKFTFKLPVEYNPTVSNENIFDTLSDWASNDEIKLKTLFQIPAQAILQLWGYNFKKAYLLQGETHSGKSTYADLLKRCIFGQENIADISLSEMSPENRFSLSCLEGKMFNCHEELISSQLKYSETFKKITGSQLHQIERKGKDHYTTRLHALHLFITNTPPTLPAYILRDPAFLNRFIYIKFNNSYEYDPTFEERIFTPEFASGLLNIILDIVNKIMISNSLLIIQDIEETKDLWSMKTDPVYMFLNDCFTETTEVCWYRKEELLMLFNYWCDKNGISLTECPRTLTAFTQSLTKFNWETRMTPINKYMKQRIHAYAAPWKLNEDIPDRSATINLDISNYEEVDNISQLTLQTS